MVLNVECESTLFISWMKGKIYIIKFVVWYIYIYREVFHQSSYYINKIK